MDHKPGIWSKGYRHTESHELGSHRVMTVRVIPRLCLNDILESWAPNLQN